MKVNATAFLAILLNGCHSFCFNTKQCAFKQIISVAISKAPFSSCVEDKVPLSFIDIDCEITLRMLHMCSILRVISSTTVVRYRDKLGFRYKIKVHALANKQHWPILSLKFTASNVLAIAIGSLCHPTMISLCNSTRIASIF